MTETAAPPGPLDGIRVLDFSMYIAGPYCTRLLADMGAEIIKVEPPGGELMRRAPPFHNDRSAYFGHMNCGKKSLELDLKSAHGIDVVHRLLPSVDVVLENFRPGVMDRLGLGYVALSALKEDLIFCSVTGYGQSGPDADRPAFATIINAASGFDMMMMGYETTLERPLRHRSNAPDFLGATHACGAIGAALFGRERTGRGQRIDVSMLDATHNLMAYEYQAAQVENPAQAPVFAPVCTADGFLMVAPVSPANFKALAAALDCPELLADPRFAEAPARIANWDALLQEVEARTRDLGSEDCEQRILAAGCPCARYLTIEESVGRPHGSHRGAAVTVEDGEARYQVTNSPAQFTTAAVGARTWVARPGQHNAEILAELGLEPEN